MTKTHDTSLEYLLDSLGPMPSEAERREFKKLLKEERNRAPRSGAARTSGVSSLLLHALVFGVLLSLPATQVFSPISSDSTVPYIDLEVAQLSPKKEPREEPVNEPKPIKKEQMKPQVAKQLPQAGPKKTVKRKWAVKKIRKAPRQMAQTAPVVAPITAPDASLPSEPEPVAVARQIPKVPVQEVPVAEDDENLEALFHGYMRAVHQRVRRSKKYPRAAIRAGIEGRVELAIVIDGSGHILECRVHKSSGIDVLDRAAVKTVSRVGNLPAPPAQLGWERRTVYVPFIYKLS